MKVDSEILKIKFGSWIFEQMDSNYWNFQKKEISKRGIYKIENQIRTLDF